MRTLHRVDRVADMDKEVAEHLDAQKRKVQSFRKALTSESDRGCALFAAAYLDKSLSDHNRKNWRVTEEGYYRIVSSQVIVTAIFHSRRNPKSRQALPPNPTARR